MGSLDAAPIRYPSSTMSQPRHILVAVGWPYASGSRHLGHLGGAYLPADIFARYHRTAGNRVLMVSGSDVHGTPITVRADEEGVDPQVIVDRYHTEFLANWKALGISWDLYTSTGTPNHANVSQDMFLRLLENGYLDKKTTEQFYDPDAGRFLPDRYVEGTCPHCGYQEARGDQCDNCGRTLDPDDLIDPRSKLSGATPEMRETEHFFLALSKLQQPVADWLETRQGWRKHVLNWAKSFVNEGLHDRAITRDIDWGIPVPVDDLGAGKRIYVWFEAVIGYLSASKEWSQSAGVPDAWRLWWENPDAESYYFVGKDNVPFHAVMWPAMLLGYGGLNLPTDVPANQFITFSGVQASASRGVGRPIAYYTERLEPDALRYALASNLPEQNDTDLSEAEIQRAINQELVSTWGNLVNRVLNMSWKSFQGKVPQPGQLSSRDRELLDIIDEALVVAGRQIEAVELRAALRTMMDAAQATNVYLNEKEPWKTAKNDLAATATTLHTALSAINGIKTGLFPFLPHTSAQIHGWLGQEGTVPSQGWVRTVVMPGSPLVKPEPLYKKAELVAEVE